MLILMLFIISWLLKKHAPLTENLGWLVTNRFPHVFKLKSYRTLSRIKKTAITYDFGFGKLKYLNQLVTAWIYAIASGLTLMMHLDVKNYLYAAFVVGFISYLPRLKLVEKEKKLDHEMTCALPVISLKLLLLTGAGMSMMQAIKTVTMKKENNLEFQLHNCVQLIGSGQSSERTFMMLAERNQNPLITRLVRIFISEGKHGTGETKDMLIRLNKDIWIQKKHHVLKKGEEASTKLLFPMAIAFVSIIIAITVPAIYQLFTFY